MRHFPSPGVEGGHKRRHSASLEQTLLRPRCEPKEENDWKRQEHQNQDGDIDRGRGKRQRLADRLRAEVRLPGRVIADDDVTA